MLASMAEREQFRGVYAAMLVQADCNATLYTFRLENAMELAPIAEAQPSFARFCVQS